jgi:hypothetical protein
MIGVKDELSQVSHLKKHKIEEPNEDTDPFNINFFRNDGAPQQHQPQVNQNFAMD